MPRRPQQATACSTRTAASHATVSEGPPDGPLVDREVGWVLDRSRRQRWLAAEVNAATAWVRDAA